MTSAMKTINSERRQGKTHGAVNAFAKKLKESAIQASALFCSTRILTAMS